MDREQYEQLAGLEDRSWWFRLKREIVFSWLQSALRARPDPSPPRVADVGCGTGGTLTRIPFPVEAIGLEYDRQAALVAADRGVGRLVRGEAGALPFGTASLDAILTLDVLEHLDDDLAAMREIHRVLDPGGFLLATVPAHPFLWSPHDVAFHHFRRYRKDELVEKLHLSGFVVERVSYAFATAFPVACLVRPAKRLLAALGIVSGHGDDFSLLPGALESLAHRATRWESAWLARRNLSIGLSLIVVASKSGSGQFTEAVEPEPKIATEA